MRSFILLLFVFATLVCNAQSVGIGTTSPDASAMLDVSSVTKGVLVPRINLFSPTDVSSVSSPATGLLVYSTNSNTLQMPDGTGFYHWDGSQWVKHITTGAGAGSAWQTTGNAGTTAINFIGTTDNQPLRFKINNTAAGIITNAGNNVGFGYQSLVNNTGISNTAVGALTLPNVSGSANTAIGHQTLWLNTTGHGNVGVGGVALVNNISGNYNVAVGTNCAFNNTGGYSNVAIGAAALFANQLGTNLVAIGDSALLNNVGLKSFPDQGYYNTAVGSKAMRDNNSGSSNTALGYLAMLNNTSGGGNVAIGSNAMQSMLNGGSNIAIGHSAFINAATGDNNVIIGANAVPYNSTGSRNIAMGGLAMNQLTSGNDNVAIGYVAANNNTTGYSNVAIGSKALYSKHTQSNIVAIGDSALYNFDGPTGSTAVGSKALFNCNAANCTAVGYQALFNTNFTRNSALGYLAGSTYNNNNFCTFIGARADANAPNYSNSAAIGDAATFTASNQVRVGDAAVNSIGGQVGWTTFSDARFKQNVQENIPGIEFIMKLHPVSYQYDLAAINRFVGAHNEDKDLSTQSQSRYTGFLAQEVEKAATELGFDFSAVDKPKNGNDHYGLRYADFVVPLVKAVQEQQQLIQALQQQNAGLLQRLAAVEAAIKKD